MCMYKAYTYKICTYIHTYPYICIYIYTHIMTSTYHIITKAMSRPATWFGLLCQHRAQRQARPGRGVAPVAAEAELGESTVALGKP